MQKSSSLRLIDILIVVTILLLTILNKSNESKDSDKF
jgi:hypothetical protein